MLINLLIVLYFHYVFYSFIIKYYLYFFSFTHILFSIDLLKLFDFYLITYILFIFA